MRLTSDIRSQDRGFYEKADQFLMDSSIFVQSSFSEDHLLRDSASQFEFSGSELNMMDDKHIFICLYMLVSMCVYICFIFLYLSTGEGLSRCILVESYVEMKIYTRMVL